MTFFFNPPRMMGKEPLFCISKEPANADSKEYRSLYGVLDIPEGLKPYVSDYKINVFEIAWLDNETVKKFKSDFRIVADYFVQVRKNKDYIPSREQIRHVNEVLSLMTVLTSDNRFEEVKNFRKAEVLKRNR